MVQQYALQSFVNTRLKSVISNDYLVALIGAILFALVHLPNKWLAAFCFVAGYFLSFVFLQSPNLIALSICHGIWGTVLGDSLPYNIMHGMVVGTGYYR
jgi:membrane protease YdiL (CAAX protease family)